MSIINLKIPGKKVSKLQEEIDCVLDHKSPIISEGDIVNLKFTVGLQVDPNFVDKLRSIKSMVETDSVDVDLQLDSFNLQHLRECLDLLDSITYIHRRNKQENITASLMGSD
jgi:hypothetical protein